MKPRILTVAGSDSGGGAGIQADIRTIHALGGHPMTAVTAITAQNTLGVQDWAPVPTDLIIRQFRCVVEDIGVDAVKTGMLGTAEVVEAVADLLADLDVPIVVDPVLASTTQASLARDDAVEAMRRRLIPLATVVTPNLGEADALGNVLALGPQWLLLKGGHLDGDPLDVLTDGTVTHHLHGTRIPTGNTHGTGCTLAAALATYLAQGLSVLSAATRAKAFVRAAIEASYPLGNGIGTIDQRPEEPA